MNLWRCPQDSDLLFRHCPLTTNAAFPLSNLNRSNITSRYRYIHWKCLSSFSAFSPSIFNHIFYHSPRKKQICSKNIPTTSPLSNERIGLNDKIHSYREIHFPLIIAPSSLQILLFGIFTAVFCVFLQYFSKNNRFFVVSFWFLPTKPYICGSISMKSNIIPLIIKT